jgi:hypothetical protein
MVRLSSVPRQSYSPMNVSQAFGVVLCPKVHLLECSNCISMFSNRMVTAVEEALPNGGRGFTTYFAMLRAYRC